MARKSKTKKSNLFTSFWNGDVSLVKSYWLVGVILSIVYVLAVTFIVIAIGIPFDSVIALYIPWVIYTTVGIWRSADKYKGPKHWSILAKVAVIAGIIINLRDLFTGNY
tara:strand:+ start:151 stop:477 length:327 start_codon:yes stop_codon:yes gene_type:complete